jgi:HlyD family type I secretion membrane fusion protein
MVHTVQSNQLSSVSENEFLPPIGWWIQFSGLFIVGSALVAVALSSIVHYKTTIKAQAAVRPQGELRLVQAAAEGKIMQVMVVEHQEIRAGDVIATIDRSQLQSQKSQLHISIQQTQLQLVQLDAQLRAIASQIAAETERQHRAVVSADAELRRTQRNYRDRQMTTDAEVEETTANLRAAEAALSVAQVRFRRYQPVTAAGALSQDKLEEAELAVQQQTQAVAVALAKLKQAQSALDPSDAEVAIAAERIAQEQATGNATLANLTKEQEALMQQRIQMQNQLERDRHELQRAEIELSKMTITATADGVLAQLNLRNPGQTVKPGEEIAQIVPSQAQFVIKALVTAQDIGKVEVGQRTQLRVSACPHPDYGTLKGMVKTISADAIVPSKSTAQASDSNPPETTATAFYHVTIEPDTLVLRQANRECSVQLGMQGRVDIISREETVLRYILRKARLLADL